jgi:hypothetical protein
MRLRVLAALPQDRPLAWDLVEQAIGCGAAKPQLCSGGSFVDVV